ncbi:hypothetical protein GCM10023198_28410 [Promicromonospora umidemergens]|uniref:Uncharacterized protein n=1 Tax=Promicromonospora umidemergens TaxID=629679 RepID=A0ABP8XBT5_9MICO
MPNRTLRATGGAEPQATRAPAPEWTRNLRLAPHEDGQVAVRHPAATHPDTQVAVRHPAAAPNRALRVTDGAEPQATRATAPESARNLRLPPREDTLVAVRHTRGRSETHNLRFGTPPAAHQDTHLAVRRRAPRPARDHT